MRNKLIPFPNRPYRSILLNDNDLCVRAIEHTPDLFNFIEKMTVDAPFIDYPASGCHCYMGIAI